MSRPPETSPDEEHLSREIDRRQRAEAELRQSEERFRATFEQAAVGMAHVARDGTWLRVNRRLCRIVGYDRSQLLGMRFQDITHPDDLAAGVARLRRLEEGEIDSYSIEKRYVRKEGDSVWVNLTVSRLPVEGEEGAFIAVVEDISRRKEAEARLVRENDARDLERRRLRAVLDLLPVGVWIADAQGRITDANPAAAAVWDGRAPYSAAAGHYHEDYRATWPDGRPLGPGDWGLARALEGEASGPEEILIETPYGRKTILNFGVPIRSREEALVGGVALSVDITDRKRVEEALRESNRRLELLIRATSGLLAGTPPRELLKTLFPDLASTVGVDVLLHHRMEDGEEGRVLELASTLRGPENGPEGGDVEVPDVDLPPGEPVPWERAVRERRSVVLEGPGGWASYPLVSGTTLLGTLSFGLRGRASLEPDELQLLQALADNVAVAVQRTRDRKAERRARLEAEEANRVKSDFMATISHELRTPLNAIIGYAELLQEGIPEKVGSAAMAQVRRIGLGARHLLQLIEEVLTFSRLEAGRERIQRETVHVGELLEEVRAVAEPLAADAEVRFVAEAAADAPVTLLTDPRKLRQILLNLVGNAVKFTEKGEVRITVDGDGGGVLFRVTDTGRGIRPEDQARLFEPFWQVEDQTAGRGGTGLGLSISRRFAELLGGTITVNSQPGQGSTFTVRVPRD